MCFLALRSAGGMGAWLSIWERGQRALGLRPSFRPRQLGEAPPTCHWTSNWKSRAVKDAQVEGGAHETVQWEELQDAVTSRGGPSRSSAFVATTSSRNRTGPAPLRPVTTK